MPRASAPRFARRATGAVAFTGNPTGGSRAVAANVEPAALNPPPAFAVGLRAEPGSRATTWVPPVPAAALPCSPGLDGASVALVHDYLLVMRGAERTFAAMADCFPGSPLFALLYDPDGTAERFAERGVTTSDLQRLGLGQRGFRALLPLLPAAAGRLRVEGHDIVLSSSSAFAHGVSVPSGAIHVCYCHSPFRYVWEDLAQALSEAPAPLRPLMRALLARIRRWDIAASRRVTGYIANSEVTRLRIAEHWGRESTVIHPPVDVDRFGIREPADYFVTVSELVRHKRVEIALEAARRAHRPIKVIGTGPDLPRLAETYGASAEFLGRVSDRELVEVVGCARALVLPGVEEFGIAAVEAQAAGRPVLAADAGGARETVIPGETGVTVRLDDVDAFADAMRSVDFDAFDPARLQANARRFSTASFQAALLSEVGRIAAGPADSATGQARRRGRPPVRGVREDPAQAAPDGAIARRSPGQVRQRRLVGRAALLVADGVAAIVALLATSALGVGQSGAVTAVGWPLLLIAALGAVGVRAGDCARIVDPGLDEVPDLFQATTLSLMALTAVGVLGIGSPADLSQEVALWITTPIALVAARHVARRAAQRVAPTERCLVLGDDAAAARVAVILAQSPRVRARVVARVALTGPGRVLNGAGAARANGAGAARANGGAARADGAGTRAPNGRLRPTITAGELPAMVRGLEVHRVIISARAHRDADRGETMRVLAGLGVGISLLPAPFEVGLTRPTVERLGGLPIFGCATCTRARGRRAVKRCLDVALAAAALVLLAPAFAVTALLIKLDSPGPVLYRQPRVGRGGGQFSILKLRTMVDRADEQRERLADLNESSGLFKLARDPRVTPIGRILRRSSLDELPQLVNVLRGEMSFVGPRPLVPQEDVLVTGPGRQRLTVAPGITGPWQVLGPLRVPIDEMAQLDYLYVADWSLWVDAKILLRTASHVLSGRGL
jgi:lipopolysaccharide/colanic/teichoic acid biosynthesis glycosyltransferase/glycosyltransferase involved in cell wall biosynthesis